MSDISLVSDAGKLEISRPCNSDLSAKQYYIVKHDSSEEVVISGAADVSLGILQNAPNGSSTEKTADVRIQGMSKVVLGGSVTFGQYITPDANGAGVAASAGEEYIAKVLTSGDSGDVAAVILCHGIVDSDT